MKVAAVRKTNRLQGRAQSLSCRPGDEMARPARRTVARMAVMGARPAAQLSHQFGVKPSGFGARAGTVHDLGSAVAREFQAQVLSATSAKPEMLDPGTGEGGLAPKCKHLTVAQVYERRPALRIAAFRDHQRTVNFVPQPALTSRAPKLRDSLPGLGLSDCQLFPRRRYRA